MTKPSFSSGVIKTLMQRRAFLRSAIAAAVAVPLLPYLPTPAPEITISIDDASRANMAMTLFGTVGDLPAEGGFLVPEEFVKDLINYRAICATMLDSQTEPRV